MCVRAHPCSVRLLPLGVSYLVHELNFGTRRRAAERGVPLLRALCGRQQCHSHLGMGLSLGMGAYLWLFVAYMTDSESSPWAGWQLGVEGMRKACQAGWLPIGPRDARITPLWSGWVRQTWWRKDAPPGCVSSCEECPFAPWCLSYSKINPEFFCVNPAGCLLLLAHESMREAPAPTPRRRAHGGRPAARGAQPTASAIQHAARLSPSPAGSSLLPASASTRENARCRTPRTAYFRKGNAQKGSASILA